VTIRISQEEASENALLQSGERLVFEQWDAYTTSHNQLMTITTIPDFDMGNIGYNTRNYSPVRGLISFLSARRTRLQTGSRVTHRSAPPIQRRFD
jgi:hypothetical protein